MLPKVLLVLRIFCEHFLRIFEYITYSMGGVLSVAINSIFCDFYIIVGPASIV